MAKKQSQYSLEAMNERYVAQQIERKRNIPTKSEVVQAAESTSAPPPTTPTTTRPQGTTLPGGEGFKLPTPPKTDSALPTTWDYKGATTNMRGEELQEYQVFGWKLAPKGFDPNGDVYFGGGVDGWLKKFAYKFMAEGQNNAAQSSESKAKQNDGWQKIKDAVKSSGISFTNPLDTKATQEKQAQDKEAAGKITSGLVDLVVGTWGVAENAEYKGSSIISPLLTTTKIAVSAAFDIFQVGADSVERIIGLNKTMREYSEENGSKLPDLEVEFDPVKIGEKYQIRDELLNTFANALNPAMGAYQTFRFFTAPGTLKEKQKALAAGWTENKILYSELVQPAIEAEYRARVNEGKDGVLLAMELQDPWAELGGELILDPLNLFAAMGKAARFTGMVADARKSTGIADDLLQVGIMDDLNDIQNVSTPAQASTKLDDLALKLKNSNYDEAGNAKVFGKQEYTLNAMTATGNRQIKVRTMSNFIAQGIGTIKQSGGTLDDVTDWFVGMLKMSSKNTDEIKDGFSVINKSKIPNSVHFSQAGKETSMMLRNIIPDGDVVKFVKKLQTGDWDETVKVINSSIDDATRFAYPTVRDMADAAKLVDDDALKLADEFDTRLADLENQLKAAVSQKAKEGAKRIQSEIKNLKNANAKLPSKDKLRLAREFQELKRTRPGVVRLAQFDRTMGKIRNPINSFFAGMYFSLSPGYAFRNGFTNAFQMVADGGLKTLFMSDTKIDNILKANFGGELPAALRTGFTLPDAANIGAEDDIVKEIFSKLDNLKYSPKNLAAKMEVWAGKRVFYKFWKDTMDSMLKAGSGLPKMDEWLKNGFSEQMVGDFVDLIKARGYNVSEASEVLKAKYANGTDLWRQLDTINDDVKKAFSDPNLGIYDELVRFVNDPETTQLSQVQDFFARAKAEIKAKAAGVANDHIGVPSDSPAAEHIAEMAQRWGDDLPQSEMDRITVLENSFGNSVQDFNHSLDEARKRLLKMRDDLLRQGQPTVGIDQRVQKIDEWKNKAIDAIYNNQSHKDRIKNNAYYFETLKPKVYKDGAYSSNANDYINAWDEAYMGPKTKEGFRNWKEAWFAKAREARIQRNEEIWDAHFADILGSGAQTAENLGEEFAGLFTKAKQNLIELQNKRNHVYNGQGQVLHRPPAFETAQVGTPQNASNIAKMASQYGLSTLPQADEAAGLAGANSDKKLLNIINKYVGGAVERPAKSLVAKATDVPRSELPELASQRFADEAKRLLSELSGGQAGKRTAEAAIGTTNVSWYRELYQKGLQKPAIDKALNKIVVDAGADTGVNVERMKDMILDNFKFGDPKSGTPPDLYVLQSLGADKKTMQEALDNFNEITKQNLKMDDVLKSNAQYQRLDDVPADVAEKAFQARSGIKAELAGKIPQGTDGETVFHGTNADFEDFAPSTAVSGREFGSGTYFTVDKTRASSYGKNVKEATLKLKKPIDIQSNEAIGNLSNKANEYLGKVETLKTRSFDGADDARAFKESVGARFELMDEEGGSIIIKYRETGVDKNTTMADLFKYIRRQYPQDSSTVLKELGFDGIKSQSDRVVFDVSQINKAPKTLTPDPSMPYYDDAGNLVEPNTQGLIPADPGYVDGTSPSPARAIKEQQEELLEALAHIEGEITKRWGMRSTETLSQAQIDQLAKFSTGIADKVNTAKYAAAQVGEKMRDFTLLPYGQTTHLDHAMSYIMPYQFWYSRTYKNWSKRLVTNADLLAGYAKTKDAMLNSHRDLPEWWKYNVKIPDFLGVNGGNPMMLNLEATIWPLNGITGVDFNDPEKRTNWFTSTIDDMGKFGPSLWTPISLAIGAAYAMNGEKEIASKWATRLIPQTATIKAISSYWGTPIELDPNVRIFNGDGFFEGSPADPYEEGRISRALAAMEKEGVYTKEQLIEAARTHKGDIWNEAYQRAVNQRASGQIMSTLFGVGFKARNEADIVTDQFYSEYARMRNLHDNGTISDEQYKQGFNVLREKYPFMDIILLSRRAGVGREEAYAYNVISRIPPGMTKEIYEIIGVDSETAQQFYDSGGKLEGMSETERARFMAAMVDAGAILAIPRDTTRREWTDAKNMYSTMQDRLKQTYGDDIAEKMSEYFGKDDAEAKRLYMELNPEVGEALDDQTAYISNNPQLLKYYGGIDTIERYYTSIMYEKLDKKYPDIDPIIDQYYALELDPKAQRAYKKANPILKQYFDERNAGYDDVLRQVVTFGDNLPEAEVQTTGNDPENPTQAELAGFAQPEPSMSFQQWTQAIGEPTAELILEYWNSGEELDYVVQKKLDKLADDYGMDSGDDLLQTILLSMPQGAQ